MPVTMVRLNLLKGVGPVLQIAEGYTLNYLKMYTIHWITVQIQGWPTTWFAPRLTGKGAFKSVYDVMNNWGPTTVLSLMDISVLTLSLLLQCYASL